MTTASKHPAAIYTRISQDDSGQGLGVQRQVEDCRELAKSRGLDVVAEFTDNDLSAFSGVRRPGYLALMAAIEAGEVDRVIVYMTSRLWRSRAERAGAMGVLAKRRLAVIAVRGPELDLATASGRMVAGILGEFDTAESEIKSERVARAAEQRAQQGRPSGGLGYGWERVVDVEDGQQVVRWEVNETEANIVREIVSRVIAEDSLRAIARDLNDRGIPSPGATHRRAYRSPHNADGSRWGESSVRKLAIRPSNAGLRVHRGEVLRGGTWPPLLDQADHDKAVGILTDPQRRKNYLLNARRHLLTWGVGECGVCGDRLRAQNRGRAGILLVCDKKGCVGRRMERVDELVEKVVIARLQRPDAVDLLDVSAAVPSQRSERMEAIRSKLDEAAAMYAADRMDSRQYDIITNTLRPELEDLERDVKAAPLPVPTEVRKLLGRKDAAKVWTGLPLTSKRAVLETLGLRVIIKPTRPGPGFDEASVAWKWPGDE